MSLPIFLADFTVADLRALAAALEARDPELVSRRRLTHEGTEKLAEILIGGSRPTVGFFMQYSRSDDA